MILLSSAGKGFTIAGFQYITILFKHKTIKKIIGGSDMPHFVTKPKGHRNSKTNLALCYLTW